MPNQDNMMFVRPKNCEYCTQGYNALYHVVEYAQQKGQWNITDLSAEQAVKNIVYEHIETTDPFSYYGFGHGLDCRYTGDTTEDIFNCDDCSILAGRIVYLLSCLTANGLGPEIMNRGAIAYAGFNISWTWIAEEGETEDFLYPDPYDDPYAFCFYESANELWMALLDGYSFREAVQQSIDKYNEWIDYWYYDNPEDIVSEDCIMWLVHDRNGLVALDQCMNYSTQVDCENAGCYWCDNECNSIAEQNGDGKGFNPLFIVPIVLVVGIAFIAGQTDK